MNTISDIFDALGGPASVARMLRVKPSTAGEMKRRGAIPSEYRQDLILAAQQRRVSGVSAEQLVAIHARRPATRDSDAGRPGLEGNPPFETLDRAAGHFSRFKHVRRSRFSSAEAVSDHVSTLRDEWRHR